MSAGSARGISPRAAHRSGREPLDSSGSCHPEKAAAFHQDKEFLRLPVDSILTWVTCSLCSTGHYPVSSLLRSSAPLIGASVLSASWGVHLCLFLLHHRPGAQVPYESPDKSHAACTPDHAWPVSRYLPCCSQDTGETLVLESSKVVSTLRQRIVCTHLSYPYMT